MNPTLRTLIFTVLAPGTVVLLIPRWILPRGAQISSGGSLILGVVVLTAGVAIYLWCAFCAFAMVGRGTPAPFDAPTRLVAHGLYRFVRNPMYWGVSLILIGEAALFGSQAIAGYLAVWFAFVFFFVLIYEEPALRHKFGSEYEEYCSKVPRWLPKLRKWPRST